MSYQVLARKWRPRNFQDMVGQEHIVRMLTNALEQKRLHHAYLFTGTRGVGKTTVARILAKCLSCETNITSNPCGTCPTCQAIDAGQFLDLYEVDAASRTKVEDTRELLDNILYPPSQGRYKIYLIDEVHMLSTHSFNALLKTLEEPPEHVKFLLATTDPKRLPITILSRCLQFHLKAITPEIIANRLAFICTTENIQHEVSAINTLAKAADGSMRDGLSLLDQAIAYGNGAVNQADVNNMLGCMAQDDILPLLEKLAERNGETLFATIKQLAERAPDFKQILEEMISMLHKIAIAQIVPNAIAIEPNIAALANQFTPEDVQLYYQIALLGRRDLAYSPSAQSGFEMTMLRMLAFKPNAVQQPTSTHEKTAVIKNETTTELKPKKSEPAIAAVNMAEWRDILPKLELTGMAHALAANCSLQKISNNKVELKLAAQHQPMLNQKLKERIEEALTRHFQEKMSLDIHITTQEIVTPQKQNTQERNSHLAQAKQTIMDDPKVKKLIEMYDATVEVALIT
ncbi:MAG: hypothetical protein ACD_46C00687G0003 [uncultured bacterium]|nr:MAG: hypothetical protein ACD_46C00687G0003 [uncultured bacterium]